MDNWKRQLAESITDPAELQKLPIYPKLDINMIKQVCDVYPLRLSPFIYNNIHKTKSIGLIKQFIPSYQEISHQGGWPEAFFSDESHPTKQISMKYPNRLVLYLTHLCGSNCRHCNRKSLWKSSPGFSKYLYDQSITWIKSNSQIEEVILTGGDPLSLPDETIDYCLTSLSKIGHIKSIRIGTRVFSVMPERITDDLIRILKRSIPILLVTQINHPDEFSPETKNAIGLLRDSGFPILNQMTLLKGINSDPDVFLDLIKQCMYNHVHPYYLFHCFNIKGAVHFRTSVQTGINLINKLTGNMGGWWIPKYCLVPHTTGTKIPVFPNPILSNDDKGIRLVDYRGRTILYS